MVIKVEWFEVAESKLLMGKMAGMACVPCLLAAMVFADVGLVLLMRTGWITAPVAIVFAFACGFAVCGVVFWQASRLMLRMESLQDRFGLMAKAGMVLMEATEERSLLERAVGLAVPSLAEASAVVIGKMGELPRLQAIAGTADLNNEQVSEIMTLERVQLVCVQGVLEHGQSVIMHRLAAEGLARLPSLVGVPIQSSGGLLGVLVLFFTDSGRAQDENLLFAAEALGRLTGLALDHVRSRKRMEDSVRAREEVCALVSHDLRNPLAAIKSGTQVVQDLLRDPALNAGAAGEVVKIVQRAADSMLHLVTDLVDLAKMEAGHLALDCRVIQAERIVKMVAGLFSSQARERQIELKLEVQGAVPDLYCDGHRVFQVMANMIGNALKFTPAGGQIRVRLRAEDLQWVEVSVEDNGSGIDKNHLPHIFERYYQPKESCKKGSGLGLFIAKRIVDAHGGEMKVWSEPAQGARFTFTLPTIHHQRFLQDHGSASVSVI